jgi:hypothetical protein
MAWGNPPMWVLEADLINGKLKKLSFRQCKAGLNLYIPTFENGCSLLIHVCVSYLHVCRYIFKCLLRSTPPAQTLQLQRTSPWYQVTKIQSRRLTNTARIIAYIANSNDSSKITSLVEISSRVFSQTILLELNLIQRTGHVHYSWV